MTCKTYGRRLGALALELTRTKLGVRLGPETPLSAELAARLNQRTGGKFRLEGGERVTTTAPEPSGPDRRTQLRVCVAALAELTALAEAPAPKAGSAGKSGGLAGAAGRSGGLAGPAGAAGSPAPAGKPGAQAPAGKPGRVPAEHAGLPPATDPGPRPGGPRPPVKLRMPARRRTG